MSLPTALDITRPPWDLASSSVADTLGRMMISADSCQSKVRADSSYFPGASFEACLTVFWPPEAGRIRCAAAGLYVGIVSAKPQPFSLNPLAYPGNHSNTTVFHTVVCR